MVPQLFEWPATVAVIGTGPSLTQADVDLLQGRVDGVIAVNDAYKLCPWATALYCGDRKWWMWHRGVPSFQGLKFTISKVPYLDVVVLKRGPETGLASARDTLALGRNSGYQAINLAVHLGATRILLLGLDMCDGKTPHFFGNHPDRSRPPFKLCLERFATMPGPLAAAGVTVLNCSRRTALRAFPLVTLEAALEVQTEVAV